MVPGIALISGSPLETGILDDTHTEWKQDLVTRFSIYSVSYLF